MSISVTGSVHSSIIRNLVPLRSAIELRAKSLGQKKPDQGRALLTSLKRIEPPDYRSNNTAAIHGNATVTSLWMTW